MSKVFLISDTHFGHANILTFKKKDGSLLRPGFKDIKDHDLELIKRWNYTVKPEDKVYHLGDVGFMNFAYLKSVFDQLNGTKVLIKGNHDNFKLSQYAQIFKDVRGSHQLDGWLLTHIPVHSMCLDRWKGNIHGHLHEHKVMKSSMDTGMIYDPQYINLCVEHWDFTPVEFNKVVNV